MLFESFESYFWKNDFPRHIIPDLKGKNVKHSLEILASLALYGPGTTWDMAKFTHSKSTEYQHLELKGTNRVRTLDKTYRRRICVNVVKNRSKKIRKYPGLFDQRFLDKIERKHNSKNNLAQTYFLSLKGCFFALGFHFTDTQLSLFIKNASQYHLIFAYLNRIVEDTSIDLVKEWFVNPIKDLIRRGLLNIDEYVSVISIFESIQMEIAKIIQLRFDSVSSDDEYDAAMNYLKYIRHNIFKHTFYTERPTSDWLSFIIEYFYPTDIDNEFLEIQNKKIIEAILLYKIMRSVHFGFYSGILMDAPIQTQKIPHSKKWKIFKKQNPQYKSPYDHDKKNHQIVDYSAGYIVS